MTEFQPHETKIAREASISFGGQFSGNGLRYLFNILLARFMGVEMMGIYSISNSIAQILGNIGKLGLDNGVMHFVSRLRALKQGEVLKATVRRALGLGFMAGCLLAGILWFSADLIAAKVFHTSGGPLPTILRYFGLAIPLSVVANIAVSASQGFKVLRDRAIALQILPGMILLAAFLVGVQLTDSWEALAYPYIIALTVSAGAGLVLLTRHVAYIGRGTARPASGLMSFSIPVLFTTILGNLLFWSDIIMLGILKDIETTGLYQPVARTATMLGVFVAALNAIFGPIVAELHAGDKKNEIRQLFKLVGRWGFMTVLPLVIFLIIYSSKVMLLFGSEFLPSRQALVILAGGQLILATVAGSSMLLLMTGYPRLNLLNNIITLAVNIGANLILIPRYGIIGAAIGSATALTILFVLRSVEIWIIHQMFPLNRGYIKILVAGFTTIVACLAINRVIFHWHTVIVLACAAGLILIVYTGTLFLLGFDREDLTVLKAVKQKFERNLP